MQTETGGDLPNKDWKLGGSRKDERCNIRLYKNVYNFCFISIFYFPIA